jgi:hypothetical protein
MDIDELVIKLSLNPEGLSRGTKEAIASIDKFRIAAKKEADDVEHQTGRMVQGFSQVTKELLGLGAVLLGIGGIKDVIQSTVGRAAGTGTAATIFGIDPAQLSAFENAMERAGVSVDTTRASVGGLATDIARLIHMGEGSLLKGAPALAQLGITEFDRNPIDFAMKFHQALMKNPEVLKEPGLANLIASQVQGLQPMLAGLASPKLDEWLKDAHGASAAQTQAGKDLSASAVALQQAAKAIANAAMESSAPQAIEAMKAGEELLSGRPGSAASHAGKAINPWLVSVGEAAIGIDRTILGWLGIQPKTNLDRINDRFGDWPKPADPERRSLPPQGQKGGYDRYPGLGGTFPSVAAAMSASGTGFQRSNDNISITANVTVTPPSGADPRTFGGLVATSLKQALPSIIGATR